MVYEFRDMDKGKSTQSEVVSESITWNGQNLDKIVPGYRTLKVKGREDNARTVTK
ncbi:hypothetical protein [Weissella minor]|uniref:Uncharacterized protein n=1 Tax=Weissella minor TaxID=1620 RepID=A0A0R2JPD6_9LACO|nr:hypothetical protein [Weissella minor]KRN77269.1 hypothetical protein IV67_GL000058 [Weissella minor]